MINLRNHQFSGKNLHTEFFNDTLGKEIILHLGKYYILGMYPASLWC